MPWANLTSDVEEEFATTQAPMEDDADLSLWLWCHGKRLGVLQRSRAHRQRERYKPKTPEAQAANKERCNAYYAANRDKVLARRYARLKSDPDYAEKVRAGKREAARRRRERQRVGLAAPNQRRAKKGKASK